MRLTRNRAGTKALLIARLKGEAPPPPAAKKVKVPLANKTAISLYDSDDSTSEEDDFQASPPQRRCVSVAGEVWR